MGADSAPERVRLERFAVAFCSTGAQALYCACACLSGGNSGTDIYTARDGCDGQFDFAGVAPGDYEIYAFESPPMDHLVFLYSHGPSGRVNVDDLEYYRRFSQTIHVVPGAIQQINLKIMTAVIAFIGIMRPCLRT